MIYEADDTVKRIRNQITDILKQVDEFVVLTQEALRQREQTVNERIKYYEKLKDKEKKLKIFAEDLDTKQKAIKKQKLANRQKKVNLDNREKKLEAKIREVKNVLS